MKWFDRLRVLFGPEAYKVRGTAPPASPWFLQSANGSTRDDDGDTVGTLVAFQVVGTAIGLGLLMNSWWVFGIALLGLGWLFDQPRVALVLGVVYSAGLGAVAGVFMFSMLNRYDAGIVCGIIAFALLLSLHLEHVRRLVR